MEASNRFLVLALLVLSGPALRAAGELDVLPPGAGKDLLRSHLLEECRARFEERRAAVARIDTPEAAVERRSAIREKWRAAIGDLPPRTPLNPRMTGVLERAGYRVEKVLYESRTAHHVTANLYVPATGSPPFPGVLVPCGHSANGKAYEAYQRISILLALHGFVALCYDPIGQGERHQALGEKGPIVWGTAEHSLADIGARLLGSSAAALRIWDGVRSLDYLEGRPEVDPKRLGCTGNSGGGTLTSYLMVEDGRIEAAAVSCYLTSLERLFATIGPQDGEQNIPGQVALGIEHADYMIARAPRPTLVLAATKDFFDIDGTWTSFREAKRLYALLGRSDCLDILEAPGGHGFGRYQREAALRWFRRWLQGRDDAPREPAFEVDAEADLRVTPTGEVLRDLRGTSVWDIGLAAAKGLAPAREAFWREGPLPACLAEVARLAGVRKDRPAATARAAGALGREGIRIEKLVIERPGEVPVPALLFIPDGAVKAPAVLLVDGGGKAREAGPGGAIEKLVRSGTVVLAIDAAGFGETAPAAPKGVWGDTTTPTAIAHVCFHLNRPLLGRQVEDVLAALDVLTVRPEVDPGKVRAMGIGQGGPVALHAAALDGRIAGVTVERSIGSWMEVMEGMPAQDGIGSVVPGALRRYDLPDLLRAIAPRPAEVRSPVDSRGRPKD
jgi:dienelactone hydrolase